jgi:hypothetical protein
MEPTVIFSRRFLGGGRRGVYFPGREFVRRGTRDTIPDLVTGRKPPTAFSPKAEMNHGEQEFTE